MSRRPTVTVCSTPGCPELRPCPTAGHERKPWERSTRRARLGVSGWQQQRDAQRILRLHSFTCHVCGAIGAMQVDHVQPIAEGGADTDDNKRPIHSACHKQKTAQEATRARGRTVP